MGGILKSTWEMLHDGRFLKKALMIACPVALQGMLNTIVNMVDTLMIGGLGSQPLDLQIRCFSCFHCWFLELSAAVVF